MEVDNKRGTVYFRSLPGYFQQERRGSKTNTLRVLTEDEYTAFCVCAPETIVITNTESLEVFEREISSVNLIPQSFGGISAEPGNTILLISWWS